MSKLSFGIDITDAEIRLASLRSSGKGHVLEDLQVVSRSDTQAVRKLLQNKQLKRTNTRFSIHDWNIRIKTVNVPSVPKAELESVVSWAFKEAIKQPIDQLVLRFLPAGEPNGEKNPYLVFGLERKCIQERLIELKKLGVNEPALLEPHIQALANCIAYNCPELDSKVTGFVWTETSGAMCGVLGGEGLLYQRAFSGLTISTGNGNDNSSVLSKIGIEVQYSCENFLEQFPKHKVDKIFLVGDLCRTPGLKESVEEATGSKVDYVEPLKIIELTPEQKAKFSGDLGRFVVAIGLAL
jgi:Tfp pilus assembly PilM family ATPase